MMRKPKLGGKKLLRVFLKGNEDVARSLLAEGDGNGEGAAGLRDLIRQKYGEAWEVELVHEPGRRSDIFLQQLREAPMPAGFDIVVLALQDDVEQASPAGLIPVSKAKENLEQIIRTVKEELDAHVLVFNCSTIDPEDHIDNYFGREDNRELRAHKLNLALMQLSVAEGISIIDVDRLIAELGGQQHVVRWCHYSQEAYTAIGQEVLRVLEDIGFFEQRPLVMQVGQRGRVTCSSSS